MTVVGTAGHVDHGKSTLLQALTGRDPDRWEEEKRRGLTIDLGFVWATLPSGREVSFVDVPGHERFIKNMLAGIESVDAALFVVAADEGWMPQSEEHLAVLDLLEVEHAVIALTKLDRVDADLVELATLEVMERLEGTTLANSPVIPVSAMNGVGLDDLVGSLDSILPPAYADTEPRLWIDRRFTISGAGTVVTGTLLGAPVAVGDSLMTYPGGELVRIRGIQSHEKSMERVAPRRRVALNLAGEEGHLERGTMLGLEGGWALTRRFTATVRPTRYVDELGVRGAYHLHAGTAAVPARLRPVGDNGVLITLEHPLPLRYGDRFILRETGRRAVVGGGTVVDPAPPRRGQGLRASATIPAGLASTAAADSLLMLRGHDRVERLSAHAGSKPSTGIVAGRTAATARELDRVIGEAEAEVDEFHRSSPLRPGMPLATLVSRLGVPAELGHRAVDEAPGLDSDGAVVWRSGRTSQLTPEQEDRWESARQMLEAGGLTPPLLASLPIGLEVVHEMVRRGELVRISPELVFLAAAAERLGKALAAMEDGFTVAEFRDALGLSRKYAVPILEWADSEGLTLRRGDRRFPRR